MVARAGLHPAVYVSVSVGSCKKLTSTYRGQDEPVWDEELHL